MLFFRCQQLEGRTRCSGTSVQRPTSPHEQQRVRAFIGQGRGLHAETAQSSWTVIFRLVIGDLTSTILVILLYCSCVLSCIQLFVTLWTVVGQAPLSMGFSRQEYWSRLPCPFPGDLPNPGIKAGSPRLQADSLPFEQSN